ncbi:hypothetical protein BH09DEP1_BH09DEP1_6890 [soil metagenome]
MKRILLTFSVLLPINSLLAMQSLPQVHEPSERTRNYVEKALKAFEIPLASIKIYGFEHAERSGWCKSDKKEIAMCEHMNDLFTEYISFHEAAHMKDDAARKIKNHSEFATGFLGGVWLGTYALLNKTALIKEYMNTHPLIGILAHAVYGGIGALSTCWFHFNIARPWATEQAEYRADKMAIEKLIDLNQLNPILMHLVSLKISEKKDGNKKINGHPASVKEYTANKKTLEKHGYQAKETKENNDLIISLTKNEHSAQAIVQNYYSKV